MVTNEQWIAAQKAERTYHTMSREEGIKHYQETYKQYFKYLNIDTNFNWCKKVIEVGPADFPALSFCMNIGDSLVVEPMPSKILKTFGLKIQATCIEHLDWIDVDEVWLFNVLQHVQDLEKVISNVKNAKCVRFFEPINYGTDICHLHNLTLDMFKEWFGDCVKYYPKNDKAVNFHQWECAYGVWKNQY